MNRLLHWGLTVCTYNRPHFLTEAIRYAINQTRPPSQIVIVDASDYWEETRDKLLQTYADAWRTIELIYEPARVRSLTYQRNQALELSAADIVFSLDDDIYLYPDAAENIMRIYEADADEEIAMIGGLFVDHASDDQNTPDLHEKIQSGAPTAASKDNTSISLIGWVKEKLEGQLSLSHHFVPYEKPVSRDVPPASVAKFKVFADGLINGGRTTFRRHYANKVRWSEILKYYGTHEDGDFSYRMSLLGRLLTASDARFFHADGNERTIARFRINTIRVRNLMALHRVHSPDKLRSALRLTSSFVKFIAIYCAVDLARSRFTFPVVRAYALGALQLPYFLFFPRDNFKNWYIDLQEKMYHSRQNNNVARDNRLRGSARRLQASMRQASAENAVEQVNAQTPTPKFPDA